MTKDSQQKGEERLRERWNEGEDGEIKQVWQARRDPSSRDIFDSSWSITHYPVCVRAYVRRARQPGASESPPARGEQEPASPGRTDTNQPTKCGTHTAPIHFFPFGKNCNNNNNNYYLNRRDPST